jgi:zinc/manganese transport system permease protein
MMDLSFGQIAQFLAAPFAASLILTGIHSYLGLHVVERGVIFVDLSLAQIAALGGTIALLLPMSSGDPHEPLVYWVSLLFTFIGAAIFAMVRVRRARIPQEAIIGITYAVASAAAILAMSKSTSQAEHLKDMLVGNILAVSWADVSHTAWLYGAVGLFHYLFRKPFLAISMQHDDPEATGLNVRFWDFLFYASFGFVVTSSVAIAGVLLVFCYCGTEIADKAIICFRCGAGTTDPVRKAVPIRKKRSPFCSFVVLLLLLAAGAVPGPGRADPGAGSGDDRPRSWFCSPPSSSSFASSGGAEINWRECPKPAWKSRMRSAAAWWRSTRRSSRLAAARRTTCASPAARSRATTPRSSRPAARSRSATGPRATGPTSTASR